MVPEPGRDDASLRPRRRAGQGARLAGVVMARPSHAIHARRLPAARNLSPAREAAARSTRAAKRHGQRAVLSGGRRPLLWPGDRAARPRGARATVAERLAAGDRRKAFRARLCIGQGPQRADPQGAVRRQIYRIDHFLGKETVQNILVLRFANGTFAPLWTRDHVDDVQITVAETVGVEHRGRFYEKTGALRDMVPNHLFQLLAMIAMEPPISFDADAVRAKKTELFQALHSISPADAVRRR